MERKNQWVVKRGLGQRILEWVNLRPEESDRTFLMFAFYATTSMGLVWLEASTIALFLQEYRAEEGLPWIYIASAGIGSGLGFLYSRLQQLLPLRRVLLIIALLMAAPLLLFWVGLGYAIFPFPFWKISLPAITVFLMRLWLEAIYVLNDLNTSITANQLFNIREIKRTYPLVSSGILFADVVSGFSLTLVLSLVGLKNVLLLACAMMLLGAGLLYYLSHKYWQAFPDRRRREAGSGDDRASEFVNRRVQGPLQRYVVLLLSFFILAQVLFLLVDFQFLGQLQQGRSEEEIAGFLGIFNGILGVFELAMQWLASSRLIERIGVFAAAMLLPGVIGILSAASTTIAGVSWTTGLFASLVLLKFLDELLHYTLFASVGPVLFQPVPENLRSGVQAMVRGIAEPLSTGATGLALLGLVFISPEAEAGSTVLRWLLPALVVLSLVWMLVIWLLRAKYVGLLVMSAERGQLSTEAVDLLELKRAVVEALDQPSTEAHKGNCIALLSRLDPKNVGEVLAPLLPKLSPTLQRLSIEKMMDYPNRAYVEPVQELINQSPPAKVLAVALRYVWLTEDEPDMRQLKPYLRPEVDPVVRGTAASLMLRRGNSTQKAEATNTLRRMLTHKQEKERVMGCRALGEAVYLQALRLYIPNLLQDESLRVRCALLEAIAATHLEEFYPSLLRGLQYKSTREDAMRALVRLENDAVPMLVELADDIYKPDGVRLNAWKTLGQIGTTEAIAALISRVTTTWGTTRRNLLKILLEMPGEVGIESVMDTLGRSGIERLIDQELMLMGQLYAALLDLDPEAEQNRYHLQNRDLLQNRESELLRRSLRDMLTDVKERLFMVMKFLYPMDAIKAVAFNLRSHSPRNVAQGLEILDNTVDIPSKRALLTVLDQRSDREKLQSLAEMVNYQPVLPGDRLRHLLELRHFLSDWALACCFHVARSAPWSLTAEQTVACLRHPKGFVREAVLSYLQVASPRALAQLLPMMKNDSDPIVSKQVQQLSQELKQEFGQETPEAPTPSPQNLRTKINQKTKRRNNVIEFPKRPGFEPS